MNMHRIDDLLNGRVSDPLVEKYEKINLPAGTTLKAVNDEYKGMKDPCALVSLFLVLFAILGLVGFVSALILSLVFGKTLVGLLTFSPAFVLMVLATCSIKKMNNYVERFKILTSILMQFRKDVEVLDDHSGHTTWEYDETCIRNCLITHAMEFLKAEQSFDKARLSSDRRTADILQCGNWYKKCGDDFHDLSRMVTKRFGVEFSKSEIFGAAAKRLGSQPFVRG